MPENPLTDTLEVDGIRYPVKVYYEQRKTTRVALGKNAILLRLPAWLGQREKALHYTKMMQWAEKRIRKHGYPSFEPFCRTYRQGERFHVMDEAFQLELEIAGANRNNVRLKDRQLIIRHEAVYGDAIRNEEVSKVVGRLMARRFLPQVQQRVLELNELHIGKAIRHIRLKNNRRVWGSCSSRQSINLATRLLIAPAFIRDYVIIHELVHLEHPNHSNAFWQRVEDIMPDYRRAENWIKKEGDSCHF